MGPLLKDPTNMRACHCGIFPVVALFCTALFIGSTLISSDSKEGIFRFGNADSVKKSGNCKIHCKPTGSEALPRGIISRDSDLEFRPLWGSPVKKRPASNVKSLLAIAVGIRQRDVVNEIIERFTTDNFTIMLFHYDGVVDEWRDLHWMDSAIHVSAINQTKWWFAKRFLHPDIVSEYSYIFLWDEDIDVKNFHPGRYLSIVQEEGLEISQPALDATNKSEVHHMITIRGRRAKVHRRMYKFKGGGRCYENSTAPPCTGWVEMMAPVFSKAAWRCVWHMIQNDLIHAWGLDMKLGYCAQGDRTKNVGVVDAEYIVHKAIPTLGGLDEKKQVNSQPPIWSSQSQNLTDARAQIRLRSSEEFDIFRKRWQKAVMEDKCWADPYAESKSKNNR